MIPILILILILPLRLLIVFPLWLIFVLVSGIAIAVWCVIQGIRECAAALVNRASFHKGS